MTWINADNLNEFYESHALLRDEKAEILPKLASDISKVLFAIKLDIPELNVSSTKPMVVMVEPVIESGSRSSICKPKKINQIDNFEETKTVKKDAEVVLAHKFEEQLFPEPVPNPPIDTISISTESSSHSNFYDAKDDEDTISHSSSSSEEDEEIEEVCEPSKICNDIVEAVNKDEFKLEYEAALQKQRDRIKELEQQVLDLTVENTRLRQLLNANKVNTSANFQVSIPRAVLRKSKTKTNYYVYEINLRSTSGAESWTIFKRYRDFYKLHKVISTFRNFTSRI